LKYVEMYDYGDGDFYSGYMLEGKRLGHGTYTWAKGDKYKGGWKLGEQLTSWWTDGGAKEENYKDGMKHGQGRLHYSNGDRYEGWWNND
jgi:hypothetical protein